MGVHVYGRRAIRRFERETGEQIVHAIDGCSSDPVVTTIDHRHIAWMGDLKRWSELTPSDDSCGVGGWRLSSCRILFGEDAEHGYHREFMRGPCSDCKVANGMLHRADCPKLTMMLGWNSINPDYWPRPVHRPRWLDDPRCPGTRTALIYRLAYELDVPPELLQCKEGPGWIEASWAVDQKTVRRAVDGAVAAIGADVIRSVGLEPEGYTLTMDWRPGPYGVKAE